MLFKHAKFYQLTQPLNIDAATLEQQCAEHAFRPCGAQDLKTTGWGPAIGKCLVHQANGYFTLALKSEEKLLPARVVNRELEDKVAQIEAETGAPVGKKTMTDLKQEVISRLLPLAFVDHSYIWGTLIPSKGLVIVQASSDRAAEVFLAMLRKTIGSLPVVPLARRSITGELTHWVTKSTPNTVTLLEEAEFKSTSEEGSIIRCKHQALDADEIRAHLDAGKMVQRVGFEYDEAFSAVMSEDGSLKRIRFTDRVLEENEDIPKDQVEARLDADIVLGASLLSQFAEFITLEFNLDLDNAA